MAFRIIARTLLIPKSIKPIPYQISKFSSTIGSNSDPKFTGMGSTPNEIRNPKIPGSEVGEMSKGLRMLNSRRIFSQGAYEDVNLRSYLGSIRPPTRLTFGFRLGRCIILHFPKRTSIHFFVPRRPRRQKRRETSRPGKGKGRWWAFGKVGPIGCLHSTEDEVRAGKSVESKQNETRKKQRNGYHDRSPSIKKNLSKFLLVSGAFKHGLVNDTALLNDDSFRKTKLKRFLFSNQSKKSPCP